MRKLTSRETLLGSLVLFVTATSLCMWWKRHLGEGLEIKRKEVHTLEEQLLKMASDILVPTKVGVPNEGTLELLGEITATQEIKSVQLLRIERSDNHSFKLSVEGNFIEMAQLLGFWERKEGRFQIHGLDFNRISEKSPAEQALVKGIITFVKKG